MSNIIAALHRHAEAMPNRVAVIGSEAFLTWHELAARVTELAGWIDREGYRRIAFELDNGIDWIVLDLAALQAGATAVPLPTFFSDGQIVHVLDDAAVECVIGNAGKRRPKRGDEPDMRRGTEPAGGRWQCSRVPSHPHLDCFVRRMDGVDIGCYAKITYTSGSTGRPTGVCLGQSAIEKVASSIVVSLESVDIKRHLCVLPLATLLENVAGVYAPVVKGVEIVALDVGLKGSAALDVGRFAECLESVRPDSIILVPGLLVALTTLTQMEAMRPDYLKMVAVGGGKVSRQQLELAEHLSIPVFEGYGLSECCSVVALNTPTASRAGSVGKPLPHARVRTNANDEIEVSGPLMAGYLGDESFERDWYPTGDLGHIDEDGYVYIDGRKRNVFITAYGRNVNPEWIEAELEQNPAIARVLVAGEGRAHNLALIWPRFEQSDADIERLVGVANERLPDYARVHRWILVRDSLSSEAITPNGRLKRDRALEQCATIIEEHYETHS